MITEIFTLIVLITVAIFTIIFLLEHGGTIIRIIFHLLVGWISLAIVNIIPGIDVPINLITVIISGFGGIFGTIVLVLLSFIF